MVIVKNIIDRIFGRIFMKPETRYFILVADKETWLTALVHNIWDLQRKQRVCGILQMWRIMSHFMSRRLQKKSSDMDV